MHLPSGEEKAGTGLITFLIIVGLVRMRRNHVARLSRCWNVPANTTIPSPWRDVLAWNTLSLLIIAIPTGYIVVAIHFFRNGPHWVLESAGVMSSALAGLFLGLCLYALKRRRFLRAGENFASVATFIVMYTAALWYDIKPPHGYTGHMFDLFWADNWAMWVMSTTILICLGIRFQRVIRWPRTSAT